MKKKTLYIIAIIFTILALSPVVGVKADDGTCSIPASTTAADCAANGGIWTPGPSSAANQTSQPYGLLAPLPNPSGGTLNTVDVAGNNALGNYLNIILKLAIGMAAVLAMVMIIMGGIQYMTSDFVSSKEEGKHRITNAIFGLLIALGAWLILYTINPNLLNTNVNIAPTTIQYDEDTPQAPTTVNGTQMYGTNAAGANWATIAGNPTTLPAGVTTDHPGQDCDTVGQTGCTSLRGLDLSYINTIITNCPSCEPLTITGGTEYWRHRAGTTHQPGSPTVDLRLTPALTQYIMGGPTQPVNLTRYSRNGISFLYEGDHWHAGQ